MINADPKPPGERMPPEESVPPGAPAAPDTAKDDALKPDEHPKREPQPASERNPAPRGEQEIASAPSAAGTGNRAIGNEAVGVWEEEGGSPPGQISSTKPTRPTTKSPTGSMGGS